MHPPSAPLEPKYVCRNVGVSQRNTVLHRNRRLLLWWSLQKKDVNDVNLQFDNGQSGHGPPRGGGHGRIAPPPGSASGITYILVTFTWCRYVSAPQHMYLDVDNLERSFNSDTADKTRTNISRVSILVTKKFGQGRRGSLPNVDVLYQTVLASIVTEIRRNNLVTRVPPFKVTGTDTDRLATYDLLLIIHSNHGPISYRFRDCGRKSYPNFAT